MKKYYRNLVSISSIEGIEVDEGSLWLLTEDNLLILVDDDQYISCKLDKFIFEESEL